MASRKIFYAFYAFFAMALVMALSASAFAASYTVGGSEGYTFNSIREEFQTLSGDNTELIITLDANYRLGDYGDNIVVFDDVYYQGLQRLVIDGRGTTTITSQNGYRHFRIDSQNLDVVFQGITIDGGSLSGNFGGGVQVTNARSLQFDHVTFQNNNNGATGSGGALEIQGSVSSGINFGDVTATNNSAVRGGAFYISSSSSPVTFSGTCNFVNNNATSDGGALYIDAADTVTFANSAFFTSNKAESGRGGAIYTNAARTVFAGISTFGGNSSSGNTAGIDGGAIFNAVGDMSFESAIEFTYNTAGTGNGGAIYSVGNLTMSSGGTFANNTATNGSGGAIYSAGSVSMLNSGNFSSNTANSGGGAVYLAGGSSFFTGVIFGSDNVPGNSAKLGGAVGIASGMATFEGVTFAQNSGDLGGALYNVGTITINNGTTFGGGSLTTGNKANSGGGFYNGGTAVMSGAVRFMYNSANFYGGALTVDESGNLSCLDTSTGMFTFTGNVAEFNGGAIYIDGSGTITANTAEFVFSKNEAGNITVPEDGDPSFTSGMGGALYITGSGRRSSLGFSEFNTNDAPRGGAVYAAGSSLIFSAGVSFDANYAYSGGAVYADGGKIEFTNAAAFMNNYAYNDGGALYTTGNSTMIEFNALALFDRNTANYDSFTRGDGGAAWLGAPGSPFNSSVEFTNNTVLGVTGDTITGNGGALYIAYSGTFNIEGTDNIFQGNSANAHGGAIYSATANINVNNIDIVNDNIAENGNGGFIWSGGGHVVTINGSIITADQAGTASAIRGGIVYVDSNGTLNIMGIEDPSGDILCEFYNSKASELGGAFYMGSGGTLNIRNSIFNGNTSEGGGVVYVEEDSTINILNAVFKSNSATAGGGAIYAKTSTATITNTIFDDNFVRGVKNNSQLDAEVGGGAARFDAHCDTRINSSTFTGNRSLGSAGGAILAGGHLRTDTSYFYNNYVDGGNGGGAIYMSQFDGTQYDQKGRFEAQSCMFVSNWVRNNENRANGGAIFIHVDIVETFNSCTFTKNFVEGNQANGGALYMETEDNSRASYLTNCTFTENSAQTSGGAIWMSCEEAGITMQCNTITKDNTASTGGGLYLSSGTITISGTIIVGNVAAGVGSDVCVVNGTLTSDGYNRIGIYGKGDNNSSWTDTGATQNSDAEQDGSGMTWTTALFFGDNDLASNDRAYTPSGIMIIQIPELGAKFNGYEKFLLLTIHLDESRQLPTQYWATGQIPPSRANQLPASDARGLSRWGSSWNISIGAITDGTVGGGGNVDNPNIISGVTFSGIPNEIRSVGQTASLIAMVYYTNGSTNYGGDEALGFEPVIWISSAPSILAIDQNGNIVALRTTYTPDNSTPGTVTITVRTQRAAADGQYATYSRAVRITNDGYNNLNVSPYYRDVLSDYVKDIFEYDLSLMLTDTNASTVSASSFQRNFKAVWAAEDVSQIDLTTADKDLSFTTNKTYAANDGYKAAKAAGVNVNFSRLNDGNLFPLTYSWNFSGDEIKSLLGYDLTNASINNSLAEELFKHLRIDFEGSSRKWVVVGDGGVSASEARGAGALKFEKADSGRGVRIELTAYLANVAATGAGDGAQLVRGGGGEELLVVPDGLNDGTISGTMWMAVKSSSVNTTPSTPANPDTPTPIITDNNTGTSGSESSGGGGGGGCSSLGVGIFGTVLVLVLKRTKK